MSAEVSRRVLVGSFAAGLPVLAGALGLSAASPRNAAHNHFAPFADSDPLLDHIVREMAAVLERGQRRGLTGEEARAIAAQLRVAVAGGTQAGIDAAAKNGLEALIRRRGRDAVLSLELDVKTAKDRLSRYGIAAEDRWFDSGAADDNTRNAAIDALRNDGITGAFSRAAGVFDRIATTLDASGPVPRVRRVQIDTDTWLAICWPLIVDIQMLELQTAAICAASSSFPGAEVACAGMYIMISMMYLVYYAYCII